MSLRVASTSFLCSLLGCLSLGITSAMAQRPLDPASVPDLDHDTRGAIVESLTVALREVYIFEDVANDMSDLIEEGWKDHDYDDLVRVDEFVERLTEDLRSVSHDRHLRVGVEAPFDYLAAPEEDRDERRRQAEARRRRGNHGFRKVEILNGNIGYLRLDGFAGADEGGETAVAAMAFLGNADALIFDLRQNGGGSPSMIQLLSSYLFAPERHLNSFYIRATDETHQFWTQSHVEGRKLVDTPVFVLTSSYTFSAAEEFTYNLKNMERATIVGETTGGGAHPVQFHFFAFDAYNVTMSLPYGRAVNPITGTNWEGTGVTPDISCPTDDALDVATLEALKQLSIEAEDDGRRGELAWITAGYEARLDPPQLSADELVVYAGTYGPQLISLEDGALWYEREGRPRFRLEPLGQHRFGVDGMDRFRLEFVVADGQSSELIGHYDDGRQDRNPRTGG